jgi:hypothetical protein
MSRIRRAVEEFYTSPFLVESSHYNVRRDYVDQPAAESLEDEGKTRLEWPSEHLPSYPSEPIRAPSQPRSEDEDHLPFEERRFSMRYGIGNSIMDPYNSGYDDWMSRRPIPVASNEQGRSAFRFSYPLERRMRRLQRAYQEEE